jgi:hypothetical protein
MRAQKMREEMTEKERDEHFNTIQSVIPMKQEWRVKEKASTPTLMISDDDMDLLDDDESPLIKDGSQLPTGMDINIVFTQPIEFTGAEEGTRLVSQNSLRELGLYLEINPMPLSSNSAKMPQL